MAKHDIIAKTLSADAGTFTVAYPANTLPEKYLGGTDHMIVSNFSRTLFSKSGDFTIAFGASNISVTVVSAILPSGASIWLHLDRADDVGEAGKEVTLADPSKMGTMHLVKINLGAPITADADGAVASQACTLATGLATGINGALAASGVATFDFARNVVAAWTGTAVLTVTGTDEYGVVVSESSASGTSLAGKKAFKTITSVTTSANITSLTVGTGTVLGLPVHLPDAVDVLKEILDGAAATAGTLVAGVNSAATATTGDVRGTYVPNSAPNGARVYELIIGISAPAYTGVAQFGG